MKSENVLVAKLGRTIGIKGFVRLHNLSDFPEQFKRGASFFDESGRELVIKEYSGDSVLFEGFESLESAKNLVNLSLFQSKEQSRKACKLGKDEFFYFDIIGLKVLENGVQLGIVKDIIEVGAHHLLLIATDEKLVATSTNAPAIAKKFVATAEKPLASNKNSPAVAEKPTAIRKNSQGKANEKPTNSDKKTIIADDKFIATDKKPTAPSKAGDKLAAQGKVDEKLTKSDTKLTAQGAAKEFYLPYVDFYVAKVDLTSGQIHAQNALTLLESL